MALQRRLSGPSTGASDGTTAKPTDPIWPAALLILAVVAIVLFA